METTTTLGDSAGSVVGHGTKRGRETFTSDESLENVVERNNECAPPKKKTKKTDSFERRDYFFTFNNYQDSDMEVLDGMIEDDKVICMSIQEEIGEEGTKHLQGYIKFKSPMKRPTLMRKFSKEFHAEAPRNVNAAKQYCQKSKSRNGRQWIKDPKKEEEEDIEDDFDELTPYPWQQEIIDLTGEKPDKRAIFWYFEMEGCSGKSTLARHLVLKKDALVVSGKAHDVKSAIATMKKKPKIIIWDVPRSLQGSISYEAIEEVKNGIFFNGKYEAGMVKMNRPHIFIFANFYPKLEALSRDRWHVKEINT